MSASTPAPAPKPARRRRWAVVPVVLLLLLLAALAWAYARGTGAESEARDPSGAADPPVSQLLRREDGHVTVRASVVVPSPRQKVWDVVTDFANYGDLLPYVKGVTAEGRKDGTKLVKGEAKSAVSGYWAFELKAHEEKHEPAWRVWWKEKGEGEVLVNDGGWTLYEHGPGETLLVLELEAEVRGTPTWVLRNFFLYRLRRVVAAVRAKATE